MKQDAQRQSAQAGIGDSGEPSLRQHLSALGLVPHGAAFRFMAVIPYSPIRFSTFSNLGRKKENKSCVQANWVSFRKLFWNAQKLPLSFHWPELSHGHLQLAGRLGDVILHLVTYCLLQSQIISLKVKRSLCHSGQKLEGTIQTVHLYNMVGFFLTFSKNKSLLSLNCSLNYLLPGQMLCFAVQL